MIGRPAPRAIGHAALFVVATLAFGGCSHLVILNDALTAAEHNDLGVVREAAGDARAAEREYRRALRLDPRLVRALVNLGNLEAGRSRWRSAERWYRRALATDPADLDARNNLAVVLVRGGGRSNEAEWLARSAVALALPRDSIPRATLEEVLRSRRGGRGGAQAGEASRLPPLH